MKANSFNRIAFTGLIAFITSTLYGQNRLDSAAIQAVVQVEDAAWNKGDAVAYSTYFAQDGTFTNIMGQFFTGHKDFAERHAQIFKGPFSKTTLQQKIVSLKFVRPNVVILETLCTVAGFSATPPPGTSLDTKGHLHTRLLQLLVKDAASWTIAAYHNVDLKPGVPVPEGE